MRPLPHALLACLAAGLFAVQSAADAAPRGPSGGGGAPGARPPGGQHGGPRHGYPGGGRPGYDGGRHYSGGHYGHYPRSYWGWGVAIGVPWGLGWYNPYWYGWGYGWPYYSYPGYGYVAPYPSYGYGYGCGWDEECWRAMAARSEETPPTTEVPPAALAEAGAPTQRPLHLNYCDSARAWYPNVRSCPGGWRVVRPEYNVAPGPVPAPNPAP
jgi:hypothetical protein